MSFAPPNQAPPISVNNEFALQPGANANPTPGQTTGVRTNNRVFPSANTVFVTVTDAAGNPLPIGDVLVLLENNLIGGIVINFTLAPIDPNAIVTLDQVPAVSRGFFQRFFVQSLGKADLSANAKVQVDGFTTYTESGFSGNYALSQGNDAVLTNTLNNVIYAEAGDDAIVVNAYAANPGVPTKSYLSLGTGADEVEITKQAIKQRKSKIEIADFNAKEDTLSLDTKERRVEGIGSDKLKITTKRSRFVVTTEQGKFSKNSVDFI